MAIAISFFSLFLSVTLLQLSSGGLGPLDALSGLVSGFSTEQIGLLGSAHFIGFFLGCWWAPRLIGTIGHSRAFAVFAASGTIGILLHMAWVDPYAWSVMRVMSGLCVAGCFTVIEGWIQAKVNNENRGRMLGIYRVVDMGAGLIAQLVVSVLEPAQYLSYNVLAMICCASLLPLALTRIPPPETQPALRLKPMAAARISPAAAAGVIAAGVTAAGFRMVGPIYGDSAGLTDNQIGYFLAAFILGGAIAQYPAGWLADKFDRRYVLIGFSIAAVASSLVTIGVSGRGAVELFASTILFGMVTFPIYSICAAHASDFAKPTEMVEVSSSLLFFYAVGAIASPLFISFLIASFGAHAMFAFIAAAHLLLSIYTVARIGIRPTVGKRTPYTYMPRTTFFVGRLLGRRRPHR